MSDEAVNMAMEFLKVTEELDALSSRAQGLGFRRAELADSLIALEGAKEAALLVDMTEARLGFLAARWRYENALEAGHEQGPR